MKLEFIVIKTILFLNLLWIACNYVWLFSRMIGEFILFYLGDEKLLRY